MTRNQLLIVILLAAGPAPALSEGPPVRLGPGGKLFYEANERGDRVPDFSSCGYAGAERDIPEAPARVWVDPTGGDETRLIQSAIDRVSGLPADERTGLRGAVLLAPGVHRVEGGLRLSASGVVLRGAGADRTTLVATGRGRRPMIRVEPHNPSPTETETPIAVQDAYVPVGSDRLTLPTDHGLRVNDRVVVTRPSTKAWVDALGARTQGIGWRAGRQEIRWERTVLAVEGIAVTLDAPFTTALDRDYGGGLIARLKPNDRLREVGVEDLTLRSETVRNNPKDEEHSWHGVVANHAEDLWVRRIRFEGFAGGAVLLREAVRRVTVTDCLSLTPVSEIGGYRRHSFFTQGQQTLVLRCWAEDGIHDFASGHCAAGPNAFVHCYAHRTNGDSGPLESWASGVLYDNVRIDGGDLVFANRWIDPPGAGWSAANCLAWQCQASKLVCFSPPTAQNWALGFWAQPVGDGVMSGLSDFLRPISLYQQQLAERIGTTAARRVDPLLLDPVASTSPTLEEAAGFVRQSDTPPRTLRDVIEERLAATAEPERGGIEIIDPSETAKQTEPGSSSPPVKIVNGWLTIGNEVLTGKRHSPTWWRGTIRPDDAPAFGPAVTRFAPGRYGPGLTDGIDGLLDSFVASGKAAYDHHYGLWYDRRRDDHLMVRRATGEAAPPFYEQPFARSGEGRAWDGLSRYDLTRFNEWYWGRLAELAEGCDERGLVLMHQCYFQHNILEAGAHWADCPWRPVNNINETGLPEPPPYIGDKRIFIAHRFYDPENEPLRELHRGYLAKCVDNFAERTNVIQFTGDEYTGPLEFTRFWLDSVDGRRRQIGAKNLIALSATKDVQDALLTDPASRDRIDVIDIRYWCYTRDGGLYAPPGGANMAPRQHLRQTEAAPGDFASIARSVREYREVFPAKPVTFYADRFCRTPRDGWAVLMGGGSLADVPPLPAELKRALVGMRPVLNDDDALLQLTDAVGGQVAYGLNEKAALVADLPSRVRWINPMTGGITGDESFRAGVPVPLNGRIAWVTAEPAEAPSTE